MNSGNGRVDRTSGLTGRGNCTADETNFTLHLMKRVREAPTNVSEMEKENFP